MARIWLSGIVLVAFFLRDLRLLSSAGPRRIARASGLYSLFSGAYATLLAVGFRLAGGRRPDLISIGRNEWVGLVVIHVLLWGMTWFLSRTSAQLCLAIGPCAITSYALVAVRPRCRIAREHGQRSWPFHHFLIRCYLDRAHDTVRLRVVARPVVEPLCFPTVAIAGGLFEPLLLSLLCLILHRPRMSLIGHH